MNKTTLTLISVTLIGVLLGIFIAVNFLPQLFFQEHEQLQQSPLSTSFVHNHDTEKIVGTSTASNNTTASHSPSSAKKRTTVDNNETGISDTNHFGSNRLKGNNFAKNDTATSSREQLLSTPLDELKEQDVADYLRVISHQAYYLQLSDIRDLLTRFPYNSDLLLAEGDILEQLGDYEDALDNYKMIIEQTDDPDIAERATLRFTSLLKQYGRDLDSADNTTALFDLYHRYKDTLLAINQWTTLHAFYAKHLVNDGDWVSFDYFYEQWRLVPNAKQKLDILRSQGEESAITSKAIPLTKSGNHFIVNVEINGALFRLLIDTGASMTVLTKEALHRLRGTKVRRQSMMQFNTAGGMVTAPVYESSTIGIGEFVVADENFAVMNFRSRYDGLLGMNYLSHFKFEIDQEGSLLFLSIAN